MYFLCFPESPKQWEGRRVRVSLFFLLFVLLLFLNNIVIHLINVPVALELTHPICIAETCYGKQFQNMLLGRLSWWNLKTSALEKTWWDIISIDV